MSSVALPTAGGDSASLSRQEDQGFKVILGYVEIALGGCIEALFQMNKNKISL